MPVVVTPRYASPQLMQRLVPEPADDVFALGCISYEMLAGQRPFSGVSEFATMQAVVNDPPAPLGQVRAGLPEGLEQIVSRLLEKDPALRFQTGEEVAAELSALGTDGATAVQLIEDGA